MLSARAVRRRSLGCLLALTAMAGGAAAITAGPASADSVRDLQQWVLDAVDAPAAWQVTQGQGVIVAVIDSGVDPDVSDLTGSVITGPDYSGVSTPPTNPNWGKHGTWMASLIAGHGTGFDSGISGIAPRSKVLSIRVLPDMTDPAHKQYQHEPPGEAQGALAKAIRYAVTNHASVISMSLGYGASSLVVRLALQYAFEHNVVVVASSGNSGNSARDRGTSQAPYSYPADYPGVLGVAAVNQAGNPAYFSSSNLSVQVAAPGVHVPAQGRDGQIWVVKGTSPACALTAGVAALIKSKYPDLAPALVVRAITSSVQDRPPGGYDDRVGFGTVDAAAALQAASRLTRFGPAGRGIRARSHFGGGPSAIPAAPIRSRGLGQLVLFCVLAAACVAMTAAAAGRLVAARPYGAADPAGRGAPVPPAPRSPGVRPDGTGPSSARPPGSSPKSASLRKAAEDDTSPDMVALAGNGVTGAVPDEAGPDGISLGEVTLDWSATGEGALPGGSPDDTSLDWATMGEVARAGTSLDDATLDWATMDWAALAGASSAGAAPGCAGPDGAAADDAGPDGAAADDAGPDGAAADDAGPDGAAADDAGPDGAAADDASMGDASPLGTVPGSVSLSAPFPAAPAPADVPAAAAAADVVLDDDAADDAAVPDDDAAVPDKLSPDFAAPHGNRPGIASPVGIVPDGVAPDGVAPDATTPEGTSPRGTSPEPGVRYDPSLDAAIPAVTAPADVAEAAAADDMDLDAAVPAATAPADAGQASTMDRASLDAVPEGTPPADPPGGAYPPDMPEAAAPDGVTLDTTFLDAAVPDFVTPDFVTPDSAGPAGAGLADTSPQPAANGVRLDAAIPDAAIPDAATPDDTIPDSGAPGALAPDALAPGTIGPGTIGPDGGRLEGGGLNGAAAADVAPDGAAADSGQPPGGRPNAGRAEPPGRWSALGRPLRGTVRTGAMPGRHAAPRERPGAIWGRNREATARTERAVTGRHETLPGQETPPGQEDGE